MKSDLKWLLPNIFDFENLGIIGSLLATTSFFEHEIGNVFHTQTKGRPVPHLLKDLLKYEGFTDIFGNFEMFFIRLLIGNPHSINLRNIVWHGFPHPSQIPEEYLSTLIIVIANFSKTLQRKHFEINRRTKIRVFRTIEFKTTFKILTFNWSSEYILETHKPLWEEIMRLFENRRYFESSLLILPQIELILRLIYKNLNKYDVSAKLDEYYITLDTIFEKTIPGKSEDNRIFSNEDTISKSSLTFLYDLFIAPNGLRLRDKIGHGEVDPEAVDQTICEYLLFIANQLLKNEIFIYKSQFAKPCQVENLLNFQILNYEKLVALNLGGVPRITRGLNNKEIEIFKRTTSEVEITKSLYSILENLDNVGRNLLESYSDKLKLLESRELRSRNRKTLNKMIDLFPEFATFYRQLILYVDNIFTKRMELSFQELNFKKTKQVVENFEKYSHKNCNEWVNVIDLISEFSKVL